MTLSKAGTAGTPQLDHVAAAHLCLLHKLQHVVLVEVGQVLRLQPIAHKDVEEATNTIFLKERR